MVPGNMEPPPTDATKGATPPIPTPLLLREIVTEAIRYWEPRRLIYNTVLAMVVVAYIIAGWPQSKAVFALNPVFLLFVLAVLANLCYCAAYLPDIFLQFSGFRSFWLRWRWALLAVGILLAAILTHFFALGLIDSAD